VLLLNMDCQVISDEVEVKDILKHKRSSLASDRASIDIPIRVSAYDEGRGAFVEEARTTEVMAWGARIVLKNWVYPNDIVRLVNLENYFEADFRIVGLTKYTDHGGAEWVVQCIEKDRNIWDVTFPTFNAHENCEPGVQLECRACHTKSPYSLMPPEIEVLKSTGLIACSCPTCGKHTYWTYAEPGLRPPAYPPFEDVAPPPRVEKAISCINTRAHRRLALQLPIVIQNEKGEEESSVTENISRAGFAAILSMNLADGEMVTFVCAQFAGGQNIKLKAESRWGAAVTPGGTKRIYGFRAGL